MRTLADKGVFPSVVGDQTGRLTFTAELSRATRHLLDVRRRARHLQPQQQWSGDVVGGDRAGGLPAGGPRRVRRHRDRHGGVLRGRAGGVPHDRYNYSAMSLAKIEATGFVPEDAMAALERYLNAAG